MNAAIQVSGQFDDSGQQREAATLGMWAFIATEVLFFGVLFVAYSFCRIRFPEAFAEGSRHTDMLLGTLETAVLLTSSSVAALAVRDVQFGGRCIAAWLLIMTALLGGLFLGIHGFEYFREYQEGLIPGIHYTQHGANAQAMQLFFFLYYALTGFHALHVAIGIGLLLTMAWFTKAGAFNADYHTPLGIDRAVLAFGRHRVDLRLPTVLSGWEVGMSARPVRWATPSHLLGRNLLVWVALLGLLALTAGTALVPMGAFNTLANMAIAVAKAALVLLFYMRLRSESPLVRLFAAAGFAWLSVLIGLGLTDVLLRL